MHRLLPLVIVAAMATPAQSTVDAYLPYVAPYHHLHTDAVCLSTRTMWAEIGVPPASQMEALLAPVYVYRQGGEHVDINALPTNGKMIATYVSDSYDGDVMTYAMKLDVTALAAQHGGTVAGRQRTINAAKLYLVSMAASLEEISASWKLSIQFVGLPSQTGLAGKKLPATTSWPYTASSALLASIRAELIDVDGSCP